VAATPANTNDRNSPHHMTPEEESQKPAAALVPLQTVPAIAEYSTDANDPRATRLPGVVVAVLHHPPVVAIYQVHRRVVEETDAAATKVHPV